MSSGLKSSSRRLAVAIALGGLTIVACQVVAGIERVEKEQRGAQTVPDGMPGVDVDTPSDPCNHLRPPPLPPTDDSADVEIEPFYLAVRSVNLTPGQGEQYPGYDLDNVCSCDRRAGTASNGESSCTPKALGADCDRDGGVDNAGASLFAQFNAELGGFQFDVNDLVNSDIKSGQRGLLIYIKKYNGKLNDREVQAGVMLTYGIVDGSGCTTPKDPETNKAPPGWCGNDKWTYSDKYVKSNPTPEPATYVTGYVNNGELVFEAPQGFVDMYFGGSIVVFGAPITVGRLWKDKNRWKLEGVLAGRIEVKQLIKAVGNYPEPFLGDDGLCTGEPFFTNNVIQRFCEHVDVRTTLNTDLTTPRSPCNAISAGIGFTAEEAKLGEQRTEDPEPARCPDLDQRLANCLP